MQANAQALLEEAAEWAMIFRYGPAGEQDHAALDLWLAQGPQHAAAWQRAQCVFQTFDRLPVGAAKGVLRGSQSERRRVLALLGGGIFISALAASWCNHPWPKWSVDAVPEVGQHNTMPLPDESQLVMETGSAVRIDFWPGKTESTC